MSGRTLRGRLGPLAEREFRLLFLGEVVSIAGTALAPVALAFAVLDLTGSATDLGLVLAAAWLPQIAFVLVGGVVADRLPRSLVLVGANALSGVAQGTVAVLLLSGHAELWHLLVTQVARGTATAFFYPAIQSVVPDTVRPSLLQQANAVIRLSSNATTIVGAAVGGVVVATAGPGWAFAFDAATYGASAAILAAMGRGGVTALGERNLFRELAEGWTEFRSRTWVWAFVAGAAVGNLVWTGASGVLAPLVAKESLGGPAALGAIIAGESAGLLAGALLALRVSPSRPIKIAALALLPLPIFLCALAVPLPTGLVVVAAVPGAMGLELSNILWVTTLQQHIPRERLARVTSYDALGSFVFIPIGYAIAGPVADAVGVSTALWGAAAILAGTTLAVLASSDVRNLRRLDDQPAETEARAIARS